LLELRQVKTVYHGTSSYCAESLMCGIDLAKSYHLLDFGKGFYTTYIREQAISRAQEMAKLYKRKYRLEVSWPLLVSYNVNAKALLELEGQVFARTDLSWSEYILNNRVGENYKISDYHNLNCKWHYGYGAMGDAEIQVVLNRFKSKEINFMTFHRLIQPKEAIDNRESNQLSFHTEEAIGCLSKPKLTILYAGGGLP